MKGRIMVWADEGKQFVLTEKGKAECDIYRNKAVGEPVNGILASWIVNNGYVIETDIPGWTKGLKGYVVVYYSGGDRMPARSSLPFPFPYPQVFPLRKPAEIYKKHYESYSWFDHELFIEEVEYDGIPLREPQRYKGKEVVDPEHYFGFEAHEVGEYFSQDTVESLMNGQPLSCMRSGCCQLGEPISHKRNERGAWEATYATFRKIDAGIWEYRGACFWFLGRKYDTWKWKVARRKGK